MTDATSHDSVDLGWFKTHLLDEILPRWSRSITDEGLFLPHFDRKWNHIPRTYGTLVSQSRLLYNFAKGYDLTGDAAYLDAVESGARFLLEHFRDLEYGGWFWSCDRTGEVLDERKDSYGHAFVIFGLSHAYVCTGDENLMNAAADTWQVFVDKFRDQHGGYVWRTDRGFENSEPIKSQNPIMHLFEALLAASAVDDSGAMQSAAQSVGDFVLTRLVRARDGRLPEVYNSDWEELPAGPIGKGHVAAGGRLDIGHAFEWSYLLSTAVEHGLPAHYLEQANRFIDYGLAIGFDPGRGGIYSPASPDGQILSQRKGWWEQCEAIRALMHFAVRRNREEFWEPLAKTIYYVKSDFIDDEYGGWYAAREPGISPFDQEKGNEWKLDYHVVGMCMEGIRLNTTHKT